MTPTPTGTGQWSRLPRRRLAPLGARGFDASLWAARCGGVGLLIALAWWAYAAVRPLPVPASPDESQSVVPPPLSTDGAPAGVDQRREILARLNRENLFDAERLAWSGQVEPSPEGSESASAAAPTVAPGTKPESIAGRTIGVMPAESLPEDVKQALTGLALRGIYFPPGSEEPVAMISRVHSGPNPLLSDPFRAGDEFEDKQHPQARWKVVAIDAPGRRVILQRSNTNAALRLYTSGPPSASSSSAGAPQPGKGPSIVSRTRDEVAADLRAANLSEAQVRRLLELAEMTDDEAKAAVALDEMASDKPPEEEQKRTGRRAPPPGLEAIAKLLQQAPTQMTEPDPPAEEPE